MTSRRTGIALIGVALMVVGLAAGRGACAQQKPEPAQALLEAAKKEAKASNRSILVVFGASW
jgi:hypothetical protein